MSKEDYVEMIMQGNTPSGIFYLDQYADEKTKPLVECLESLAEQKYPESVFEPITDDRLKLIRIFCEQVLEIPLDRLSAHYGRIFQKIFSDQAGEALKQYK